MWPEKERERNSLGHIDEAGPFGTAPSLHQLDVSGTNPATGHFFLMMTLANGSSDATQLLIAAKSNRILPQQRYLRNGYRYWQKIKFHWKEVYFR
jgi:hypothetical protein